MADQETQSRDRRFGESGEQYRDPRAPVRRYVPGEHPEAAQPTQGTMLHDRTQDLQSQQGKVDKLKNLFDTSTIILIIIVAVVIIAAVIIIVIVIYVNQKKLLTPDPETPQPRKEPTSAYEGQANKAANTREQPPSDSVDEPKPDSKQGLGKPLVVHGEPPPGRQGPGRRPAREQDLMDGKRTQSDGDVTTDLARTTGMRRPVSVSTPAESGDFLRDMGSRK